MSNATGTLDVPYHTPEGGKASQPDVRDILGVDVCVLDRAAAFGLIERAIATGAHRKIAFLNAHGGNLACKDGGYRQSLKQFLVLADGIGVDAGSTILYGRAFPANLNGTDFVPKLFKHLEKPCKIGLLGAAAGVAEAAASVFAKENPRHQFCVISDGYFDPSGEGAVLRHLMQVRPDILLVAFGNPKQEMWIAKHCNGDNVTVPIGVGALFDFVAGKVPRAPAWMIKARLEWVYRLWLEPARMWRRYILGNPLFLLRILRQKFFGQRSGS